MNSPERRTVIGVDVGGTHTDVLLARPDGVHRGKVPTTPQDLSIGVVNGIELVAGELGLSAAELLRGTERVVNGTTAVTNAVTELRGARVGTIVTRGFRDTFRIARGPRTNEFDDHVQRNVPELVAWERIAEVSERTDYRGEIVLPLDEAEVAAAARSLVEEHGCDAIAVNFLWSFINPSHETRTKAILAELYPELYVVTSNEIHPLSREFERWNTAIFTAMVHDDVQRYTAGLESRLRDLDLAPGSLSIFQALGGTLTPKEAAATPLQLMNSGPVGGIIASKKLAERLELGDVICADMGGTTFDVGLLENGDFTYSKRRALGHEAFITGLDAVDIVTIGAGGGSVAWRDSRGIPQVGPHSAGAVPGPAAYGAGGQAPTVTDAMVVMGFLDPAHFLGGRGTLDIAAATAVIGDLGAQFGWTAAEMSAGIHDIAVSNMNNAIREVSVERGNDPRDFTLLAYGGMTALFAWAIADHVGIRRVVIPPHASAFSAWGVILADHVRRYARTLNWDVDDAGRVGEINAAMDKLAQVAISDAQEEGRRASDVVLTRTASFRFLGQSWELDIPLPERPLVPEDAPELKAQFVRKYEQTYGEGTAWKNYPVVLLDFSVTATAADSSLDFPPWTSGTANPAAGPTREIFDPLTRTAVTVTTYEERDFGVGASVVGPALIEGVDLTIYVPDGVSARRAPLGDIQLTRAEGGS